MDRHETGTPFHRFLGSVVRAGRLATSIAFGFVAADVAAALAPPDMARIVFAVAGAGVLMAVWKGWAVFIRALGLGELLRR